MAYLEKRHAEVGSSIGVFNLKRKPKAEVSNVQLGDEVLLHNWATILPRLALRRD